MSKVLLITKQKDGTNHIAPIALKSFWQGHNNRVKKAEDKVVIKEISESEAKSIPFKDDKWVNPVMAQSQVVDLKKDNEAKEQEIEDLKKQLAALQAAPAKQSKPGAKTDKAQGSFEAPPGEGSNDNKEPGE